MLVPFNPPNSPRHQFEPVDSPVIRDVNRACKVDGAVAQLGERVVRNDEVSGSIPLSSTKRPLPKLFFAHEARSSSVCDRRRMGLRGSVARAAWSSRLTVENHVFDQLGIGLVVRGARQPLIAAFRLSSAELAK